MPMNPRLLVPRAAGGFDPLKIAGLEAWWDAADANSVTLDSGRVATWADKSGKGRNATNSTSGSTQPDYVTAARNGRNVIRFVAASSQRLSVPSSTAMFNFLHNGTPSYIAGVWTLGTTASPNAFYGVIASNDGGNTIGFLIGMDDRAAQSRSKRLWFTVGNGTAQCITSNAPANDNFFTTQSALVFEALVDAGNATAAERLAARHNGGTALKNNSATAAASASNAPNNLFFGCAVLGSNSPTLHLQGDICEILMYSQHPTAEAQTAIRRYLAAKWGVTLA